MRSFPSLDGRIFFFNQIAVAGGENVLMRRQNKDRDRRGWYLRISLHIPLQNLSSFIVVISRV